MVFSVLREIALRAGRLHEAIETGRRALDLAERSGDPKPTVFERANPLNSIWAFRRAAALAEALPYPAGSRCLALGRRRCTVAHH
jgi:hypothetical protein